MEANKYHEKTRNDVILISFVIGGLFLAATFIVGDAYFKQANYDNYYERYLSVPNPDLVKLNLEMSTTMNSYGWNDKDKGVVRIPTERAMELVVEESRRRGQE